MIIKRFVWFIITSLVIVVSQAQSMSSAQQIEPYEMQQYDQEIQTIYQQAIVQPQKSVTQNIQTVAHYFLGRPFQLFANGEGPTGKYDQSPLYRTDLFDCQTFIATVLALSESRDLKEFQQNIIAINYVNNIPDFLQRNHFIAIQWNVSNQRKGYIRDITKQIYPNAVTVPVGIELGRWFHHLSAIRLQTLTPLSDSETAELLQSLHQSVPENTIIRSTLTYIPRQVLLSAKGKNIIAHIPNGTIIEFVMRDKVKADYRLTHYHTQHFSFLVQEDKQVKLIYASLNKRKVVTTSFLTYVRYHHYFIGINLELPISHTQS